MIVQALTGLFDRHLILNRRDAAVSVSLSLLIAAGLYEADRRSIASPQGDPGKPGDLGDAPPKARSSGG
jgi:hypothetical protein